MIEIWLLIRPDKESSDSQNAGKFMAGASAENQASIPALSNEMEGTNERTNARTLECLFSLLYLSFQPLSLSPPLFYINFEIYREICRTLLQK